MEKISGILPSTPRIQSVDLSSSGNLRPGVPSFGRPSENTPHLRLSNNSQAQPPTATLAATLKPTGPTSEEQKVQIVKDMESNFFTDSLKLNQTPIDFSNPDLKIDPVKERPQMLTLDNEKKSLTAKGTPPQLEPSDLDLPDMGRYINLQV